MRVPRRTWRSRCNGEDRAPRRSRGAASSRPRSSSYGTPLLSRSEATSSICTGTRSWTSPRCSGSADDRPRRRPQPRRRSRSTGARETASRRSGPAQQRSARPSRRPRPEPAARMAISSHRRLRSPQPLRAFAHRDFLLYWIALIVSLMGDGIYSVAIAWQVYHVSNRPSALAYVGAAWTLPQLASLLFAGAISDRFDRRRVLIVANATSGVAVGTIALLTLSGAIKLWELWFLVAVHGIGVALFIPAAGALVPQIVPADLLVEANAVRQFVRPLTLRLLGPALGGVLVAAPGSGEAFLVDSLSFFFALGAISLIRSRPRQRDLSETASVTREVVEGIRF